MCGAVSTWRARCSPRSCRWRRACFACCCATEGRRRGPRTHAPLFAPTPSHAERRRPGVARSGRLCAHGADQRPAGVKWRGAAGGALCSPAAPPRRSRAGPRKPGTPGVPCRRVCALPVTHPGQAPSGRGVRGAQAPGTRPACVGVHGSAQLLAPVTSRPAAQAPQKEKALKLQGCNFGQEGTVCRMGGTPWIPRSAG